MDGRLAILTSWDTFGKVVYLGLAAGLTEVLMTDVVV